SPTGIVYYRVLILDLDGNRNFTEVKTVELANSGVLSVYPNPADSELKISSGTSLNNQNLRITNAAGQVSITKRLTGNAPYSVDVSTLRPGAYYVLIEGDNGRQSFNFIKK
ncbi:MAG: T9SS type A sorting domain-containing protein, partial [Chitinophagaceae bacterium]